MLNNADDTPADDIFKIIGDDLTVQTSDSNKANIYELKVVASVGSYVSAFVVFKVDVTNNCGASTFSKPTITTKSYTISSPELSFSFTEWEVS